MAVVVPHIKKSTHGPLPSGWGDDPDVRLMCLVRDGDELAFEQLQQRYAPRVLGFLRKQLRDRAEAEDLTQDVFLRLYRARLRYQPRARFATWIFHIAQNVARNAQRTRRRRPYVHLDPGSAMMTDHAALPSRSLERIELAGQVRAAVAELLPRQRRALELHQFHDRTYAEVAADLALTPKAAKSLLYRARNQLREILLQGRSGFPV